jgi:hypothetical protein
MQQAENVDVMVTLHTYSGGTGFESAGLQILVNIWKPSSVRPGECLYTTFKQATTVSYETSTYWSVMIKSSHSTLQRST